MAKSKTRSAKAPAPVSVEQDTAVVRDQHMADDASRDQQQSADAGPSAVTPVKPSASEKLSNDGSSSDLMAGAAPLTEEEVEKAMAPSQLCQEEERLRHDRQEVEEEVQAPTPVPCLNQKRFAQLDNLLSRANAYTSFLSEKLVELQAQSPAPAITAAAAAAAGAAAAGSSKGRPPAGPAAASGGAKGRGKKRGAAGGGAGSSKAASSSKRSKREGSVGSSTADGQEEEEEGAAAEGTAANSTKAFQALIPIFKGELRDYQVAGVRWLLSMHMNGMNGILADQMGLGKTVQTVAFLAYLRCQGTLGPHLVVGPLSTLANWVNEVKRWVPSMPVLLYHGDKKERAALRAKHMPRVVDATFPVVVTSYEVILADMPALLRYSWKCLVVDEGHRLKNTNCRLIRELRTLNVENKILLTGTPLQNNLSELWSLLNFLLPDVFSSLAEFEGWFDFSGSAGEGGEEDPAANQRHQVVAKLHDLLRPFLLRRLKADVEIALPRKQEVVLYAPMSEVQKQLNQQVLDKSLREEMAKLAEAEGGDEGRARAGLGKLRNVLMQMRKIANHPDLVTSPFTHDLDYPPPEVLVEQAGKMGLLKRLLDQLHAGGHKVLIFSQMTQMLDLIQSYLEQTGHPAARIDGSIPWQQRQAAIDAFNGGAQGSPWVFLLSTRAGGLGINLTAADTVIIYDSDWNPQQDLQAMDRCHRIGQTAPVLVFRLATAHSVEGRMLRRAAQKMALERVVMRKGVFKAVVDGPGEGAGSSSSSLSAAELMELLRSDVATDDDQQQAGAVSEEVLAALLDRAHLEQAPGSGLPYPAAGVGYEVIAQVEGSGLLSGVQ